MGATIAIQIVNRTSLALDCQWSGGTIQNVVGPSFFHIDPGQSQIIGIEKDDAFKGGGFTRSADVNFDFSIRNGPVSVSGPVKLTWQPHRLIEVSYHCGALWTSWIWAGYKFIRPEMPVAPLYTIPSVAATQPDSAGYCTLTLL